MSSNQEERKKRNPGDLSLRTGIAPGFSQRIVTLTPSKSTELYETLRSRFSEARLAPYEDAAKLDAGLALALYDWNMQVSGAFYEDLGAFEVLLRNALDERLREKYQVT